MTEDSTQQDATSLPKNTVTINNDRGTFVLGPIRFCALILDFDENQF